MSFNNTSLGWFKLMRMFLEFKKKRGYLGKLRWASLFISFFISKHICVVRAAVCLTWGSIFQPPSLPCPTCAAWRSGPCWGASGCARSAPCGTCRCRPACRTTCSTWMCCEPALSHTCRIPWSRKLLPVMLRDTSNTSAPCPDSGAAGFVMGSRRQGRRAAVNVCCNHSFHTVVYTTSRNFPMSSMVYLFKICCSFPSKYFLFLF